MTAEKDSVVLIFCKAPQPGQVKTRLTPPLSHAEAAQLHIELAERTIKTATKLMSCAVELWCAPIIDHPFFGYLAQTYQIKIFQQRGDDLGERMHEALCDALMRYRRALLIGCDCPVLSENDLEQGFKYLTEGVDCVIAPAEDGGYVLVGMSRPHKALFAEMPWGSDQVMAETTARLGQMGVKYRLLATRWDVDREQDWQRYLTLKQAEAQRRSFVI